MVYARLRYKVEEPSSLYGARDFTEADFYGMRPSCVGLYDFFSYLQESLDELYMTELYHIGIRKDALKKEISSAIINKKGLITIKKLLSEKSSLRARAYKLQQLQNNNADEKKRTYLDALACLGFRQTSVIREDDGTITEVFELQDDTSLLSRITARKEAFKNAIAKDKKAWQTKYNIPLTTEESEQ